MHHCCTHLPKNWVKENVKNKKTICARSVAIVILRDSGTTDPKLHEAEIKHYWNTFGKVVMNKKYIDMKSGNNGIVYKQHESKMH